MSAETGEDSTPAENAGVGKVGILDALERKTKSDEANGLGIHIRYPILVLTMLALSIMTANVVSFSFTVLCMPGIGEAENENHTYNGYEKNERTVLFSSVAVGALAAVVPCSHATHTFGTRWVFFSAGILSGIVTALIPLASRLSFHCFVVLRVLQGVSLSALWPTVGSITASWASLQQHGLFMSSLTTFGQISAVYAMPVSGVLCTSTYGWASVFYLNSFLTLVIFSGWLLIYRNQPGKHPLMSSRELSQIRAGRSQANLQKYDNDGQRLRVPYMQIVSTPSIWGVWIGAAGDLMAAQLIHIFSPLYIHDVMGYSIEKTGWTSALPVLFQFFVKMFAGHSSDRLVGLSETTKLRVFNSLALGASALFMTALAFVPKEYPAIGIAMMTLSNAMFGFNSGGFNKCASLVSRQYSNFVMSNIQIVWCLSLLISPVLVNSMLVTGAPSEWRVVFLTHSAILLITNVIFCLLATAKPASWTDPTIEATAKNSPAIFF